MACSAHVMRLTTSSRQEQDDMSAVEQHYQHKCLRLLIPVLDDVVAVVQDEAVLATIVILRMSEQYNEYHIDGQYHLVPGAFNNFAATGRSSTIHGGLREATFYSYVRSDIRMAILGRCGTRISLATWPLDTSQPTSDADWANRSTWLLVQAINLCYTQGADETMGVLPAYEIKRLVDEWHAGLPATFSPYYTKKANSESFPVIRLLSPWHGMPFSLCSPQSQFVFTNFVHGRELNNTAYNSCGSTILPRDENSPGRVRLEAENIF